MTASRVREAVGSGWIPAFLVGALQIALLVRADYPLTDALVFLGYLVLGITLPGTLVWRWVDRVESRSLFSDLVVGTVVGYLIQLPAYLAVLAVDSPRAIILWPAVVVVATLVTPSGRRLWRTRSTERPSVRWKWTLALVMAHAAVSLGRIVQATGPNTDAALSRSYVDEPYHLALVGELKYHFLPQVPYAEGARLYYHWLVHAHTAASSWSTGLETPVLLRGFVLTAVALVTMLAVVAVTNAIVGRNRWWPGIVALVVLNLNVYPSFFGWTTLENPWAALPYLTNRLFASPTFNYAQLPFLLALLLVTRILRSDATTWRHWALVALAFFVTAGGKSSSLPPILAGLVAAGLVALVVQRRLAVRTFAIAAIGAASFVAAQALFYGPGTRATVIDPFRTIIKLGDEQNGLLGADGEMPFVVIVVLAAVMIVLHLLRGIGGLGLVGTRGSHLVAMAFLVLTWAAGIGAWLILDHPSLSQYYFYFSVMTIPAVLAGVGLAQLLPGPHGRRSISVGAGVLAVGALAALATRWLTTDLAPAQATTGPEDIAWSRFALPLLVGLLLLTAAFVVLLVLRRRLAWSVPSVALVCLLVLGAGLVSPAVSLRNLARDPLGPDWKARDHALVVGRGGVPASRWLREHSSPNDRIATNAHCRRQRPAENCDRRRFWLSGYSERRVLVEGWAYVAPETVGMPANTLNNSSLMPYWDPELLAENDAAFERPTRERLAELRDRWDVHHMVVDMRSPVDLVALTDLAPIVFERGYFVVVRIPEEL